MRTTSARPVGVQLISGLYFLKASAMAVAIGVALIIPDSAPAAQRFAAQLAPLLQLIHSNLWLLIAPLFVLLGIAVGVGVWFLQGWAWGLLVVMCGVPLVRLAQFLFAGIVVNRAWLSHLPSSPLFVIDVSTSVLIVWYLLQDDVKRAFGDRN
jgi:hypothetical protein